MGVSKELHKYLSAQGQSIAPTGWRGGRSGSKGGLIGTRIFGKSRHMLLFETYNKLKSRFRGRGCVFKVHVTLLSNARIRPNTCGRHLEGVPKCHWLGRCVLSVGGTVVDHGKNFHTVPVSRARGLNFISTNPVDVP